jgi:hypothetical protein
MGLRICFQTNKMGLEFHREYKTTLHITPPPFKKHFYSQFDLPRNWYYSFLFQTELGNIRVPERHVSYPAWIDGEGFLSIGINGGLLPLQ